MAGKSKVLPENHWVVALLAYTAKTHLSYLDLSNLWKQ